jgi:D-serine deaminase-like pyridoxal phosphate-dependent protein
MPQVSVERRTAPRFTMVLAAEVVESPSGAKLNARTADISLSGCYVDTLNPLPAGSRVRVRITHHQEVFQAIGRVVYVSPGLGMGIAFLSVEPEEYARLNRWFTETGDIF